jgi:hypothetical protein
MAKLKLVRNGDYLIPGEIQVIGKKPKYLPYVNIDNSAGQLMVSLDGHEMARLIKAWKRANLEE